jgi:hypothetical protein
VIAVSLHRLWRRASALTGLLAIALAGSGRGAESAPPVPACEARLIATAPVIDGSLDDACWRDCPRLSGFTQVVHARGRARYPTEAMVCFDGKVLFFGIVCPESEPMGTLRAVHHARDGDVWSDDSVELFLDPGRRLSPYYHFTVNTNAARYDGQGMDKGWDGEWSAAAQLGPGQYTLEVAIPLAQFGPCPQAGDVWGLNLCRDHYANGRQEWSCWSNTLGGFHSPGRFGLLVFGNCRTALARFVQEQEQTWAGPRAELGRLVAVHGTEAERSRLTALDRAIAAVRAESAQTAPLSADQWNALTNQWTSACVSLAELELDARFRLLFAD